LRAGAAAFTCRDLSSLDCLSAAPRESIHAALTRPSHILRPGDHGGGGGGGTSAAAAAAPAELGLHAGMEDACLAFQLFDHDPACANVADWFTAFCAVHAAADADGGGGGGGGGGAPAAVRGQKRGGAARTKRAAAEEEGERDAAAAARARELAARFSQAAAELQFVGLLKPSRKRRGEHVQRVVHMPAAALGE
jgi:hypothetical protein